MASLSTVYAVTILLGSIAAIGAAMVGTMISPITKPPVSLAPETVEEPAPAPAPSQEDTEKSKIKYEKTLTGGLIPLYKPETNQHDKVVYAENLPDKSFFKEQIDFINSLSPEEKNILISYTLHGDTILNSILRNNYTPAKLLESVRYIEKEHGKETIPLLFGTNDVNESNIVELSTNYVNKFKSIFDKAPILKTQLKVFRGTTTPTDDLKGFTSTTYSPLWGTLHTFSGEECCVYELTLNPGVKAILLETMAKMGGESEILLSNDSTLSITGQFTKEVWNIGKPKDPITKRKMTVYEGTIQAKAP